MKKIYLIELNITSTTWETAEAFVEAESEEEARKLFEDDPDAYDWENWETHDSETRSWEIESVKYDTYLNTSEEYLEQINAKVQDND